MRLSIIRHGDPDYNNDTVTPAGAKEAAALVPRLRQEGITHCYTSPMGRARATAAPFVADGGYELPVLDWAEEWWRLYCPQQDYMLWDLDPAFLRTDADPARCCEEGPEALHYHHDRMVAGSDALLRSHGYERLPDGSYLMTDGGNDDHLAVFCHGGFGLAWLAHLLGQPLYLTWASHWLSTTSVSTVLFENRDDERAHPRLCRMADTGHLLVAGLPILPRGLKANTR